MATLDGRRRSQLVLLLPVVLAGAVYLGTAGGRAVLDADEALYVHAGQQMLARGDWVTPWVNGVRFLDKPPLLYWLLAGCYRLFGENEFAAHLPPVLAVLATTWLLVRMGGRAAGPRAGVAVGLAFSLCAGTYLFTRETLHDGLLVFFLTLATEALLLAAVSRRRWAPALLFGVALGGALLSKGLVGVLFPCATALLYALASPKDERPRLRVVPALAGAGLFCAIALPWHVLVEWRNPGFLRHYVWNEQILRFVNRREPADFDSLPLPVFFGLLVVWFLPWTAFVPAALRRGDGSGDHALRAADHAFRATRRLAFVWLGVMVEFFAVSARLEHYAFPLLAPLSLLVGLALARGGEERTASRSVGRGFAALAVFGLVAALAALVLAWVVLQLPAAAAGARPLESYGTDFGPLSDLPAAVRSRLVAPAVVVAAALAIGFVGAWRLARRGRSWSAVLALAGAMLVFDVCVHWSLGICEDVVSSKRFGLVLDHSVSGSDRVVVVGDYETANSLSFYQPRPVLVDGSAPTLAAGLAFPGAPPVLVTPERLRSLWAAPGRTFVLGPEQAVEALALGPACLLARSSDRVLVRSGGCDGRGGAPE